MTKAYELDIEPARVLDVTGRYCPVPIIELAKALQDVEVGEVVLAISTDPGFRSDVPAWCKSTGNELLSLERNDERIEARVRRQR